MIAAPSTVGLPPRAGVDALNLDPRQAEALVRVVEAAQQVARKPQFFVWGQSQVYALLPHEVLVCGAYLRQRRMVVFEAFQSVVLTAEVLNSLTEPGSALLRAAATLWIQGQGRPLQLPSARLIGEAQAQAQRLYAQLSGDCPDVLVHGVARPQRPGEIESLFLFAGNTRSLTVGQRLTHLELLMPYLHNTWRRVQAEDAMLLELPTESPERGGMAPRAAPGPARTLSLREREILLWARDGKSNQQIGDALGISPLTVKNHIQKILRKLGASNRAHAVALAMSKDLLGAPADQRGER